MSFQFLVLQQCVVLGETISSWDYCYIHALFFFGGKCEQWMKSYFSNLPNYAWENEIIILNYYLYFTSISFNFFLLLFIGTTQAGSNVISNFIIIRWIILNQFLMSNSFNIIFCWFINLYFKNMFEKIKIFLGRFFFTGHLKAFLCILLNILIHEKKNGI